MARLTRQISYPLWGSLLALGAPLGLIGLRLLEQLFNNRAWRPNISWLFATLAEDPALWVYLFFSTTMVFGLVGWHIGRQADELSQSSATDPLTGLGNRRYFDSRLRDELDRASRSGEPLSVLFIDVDHLKAINDLGGHAAGDEALRLVGGVLERCARGSDVVARIGGDEFALLAPSCDAADANVLAERIVASASSASEGRVTVSIGTATAMGPTIASSLVERADGALYQAKAGGRNCARSADSREGVGTSSGAHGVQPSG